MTLADQIIAWVIDAHSQTGALFLNGWHKDGGEGQAVYKNALFTNLESKGNIFPLFLSNAATHRC